MTAYIIKMRGSDLWCQWIDAGHGPRVTWVRSPLEASTLESQGGEPPTQGWLAMAFGELDVIVEPMARA